MASQSGKKTPVPRVLDVVEPGQAAEINRRPEFDVGVIELPAQRPTSRSRLILFPVRTLAPKIQ